MSHKSLFFSIFLISMSLTLRASDATNINKTSIPDSNIPDSKKIMDSIKAGNFYTFFSYFEKADLNWFKAHRKEFARAITAAKYKLFGIDQAEISKIAPINNEIMKRIELSENYNKMFVPYDLMLKGLDTIEHDLEERVHCYNIDLPEFPESDDKK